MNDKNVFYIHTTNKKSLSFITPFIEPEDSGGSIIFKRGPQMPGERDANLLFGILFGKTALCIYKKLD